MSLAWDQAEEESVSRPQTTATDYISAQSEDTHLSRESHAAPRERAMPSDPVPRQRTSEPITALGSRRPATNAPKVPGTVKSLSRGYSVSSGSTLRQRSGPKPAPPQPATLIRNASPQGSARSGAAPLRATAPPREPLSSTAKPRGSATASVTAATSPERRAVTRTVEPPARALGLRQPASTPIRPAPPKPAALAPQPDDGRVPCPVCAARFHPLAAQRHIPLCGKAPTRGPPSVRMSVEQVPRKPLGKVAPNVVPPGYF